MSFKKDTINKALVAACKQGGVLYPLIKIKGPQGGYGLTRTRYFVMAYLHECGWSMPRIAKALGLKNHTSVLYGLRRAHGHDGKLPYLRQPLWNKELFKNRVAEDFPPVVHEDNAFTNGRGWAA